MQADDNQQSSLPPIPSLTITPPEVKQTSYEYYLKFKHLAMLNGEQMFSDPKKQIQSKHKLRQQAIEESAQETESSGVNIVNITLYKECNRCNHWILRDEEGTHMSCHAAIIRHNILLGDRFCSMSRKQLIERLKVTHIVNAARSLNNYFVEEGIKYLQLQLDDDLQEDPIPHLIAASDFMAQALQNPSARVFVHCNLGRSRSVSAILVYLLRYENVGIELGLAQIKEKRAIAKPNPNYMKRLLDYERSRKQNGQ